MITLFTVFKLLVVNGYIHIKIDGTYHILAFLQLILLFIYSLAQS